MLTGLEHDRDSVADVVDWVAKQRMVEGFRRRHRLEPGDPRLKAIDLQYHDMRRDKCLADRVGLEKLVTDDEVGRR